MYNVSFHLNSFVLEAYETKILNTYWLSAACDLFNGEFSIEIITNCYAYNFEPSNHGIRRTCLRCDPKRKISSEQNLSDSLCEIGYPRI